MTADRECLEVLRVLGHELRRPLTVIRGAASLLVEEADALPSGARRQMMSLIESGVDTLVEMIDDMSTAAHLAAGDVQLTREPVDLGVLVRSAVDAALRQEPDHRIEVHGVDGVVVSVDPEHAARVLRAVLSNAVRFSPADRPVGLVARCEPATVTVQVLDRGPGIAAEHRERVFERFQRLSEQGGGAGLGLYLARGLARAMGGEVALADRDGGGCAVCVTLSRRG